jgi:hypothetical protein
MVRAINADIKTMTRRTRGLDRVNAAPAAWIHIGIYLWPGKDRISATFQHRKTGEIIDIKCPYGNPGDRLWIKENWRVGAWQAYGGYIAPDYMADGHCRREWIQIRDHDLFFRLFLQSSIDARKKYGEQDHYKWEPGQSPCRVRPSIFMPRELSRLNLDIVSIRIERLMDITEPAAVSEGVGRNCPTYPICHECSAGGCGADKEFENYIANENGEPCYTAVDSFASLWIKINGRESLDLNPYVWVIGFMRSKPNSLTV